MAAGRPWARLGEQRENAMGKADDGDGAAPYNYAHFDDYVATGGDVADEAAFWASPRAGQRARFHPAAAGRWCRRHAVGPVAGPAPGGWGWRGRLFAPPPPGGSA